MIKNLQLKTSVKNSVELCVVGSGPFAYLWIGLNGQFTSYRDNDYELRKWLQRASERMNKDRRRRRANVLGKTR